MEDKFEKKIYEMFNEDKFNNAKREIESLVLKTLADFFRQDILEYLIQLRTSPNCIDCIHWDSNKRTYWICDIADANIRTYSKDNIRHTRIDKEMLPFIETYAMNGCTYFKDKKYCRKECEE